VGEHFDIKTERISGSRMKGEGGGRAVDFPQISGARTAGNADLSKRRNWAGGTL